MKRCCISADASKPKWIAELPEYLEQQTGIRFVAERDMTPDEMICELKGFERWFFKCVLGGKMSKKMYRLYEYF